MMNKRTILVLVIGLAWPGSPAKAQSARTATSPTAIHPAFSHQRFGEIFLYGMVVLVPGAGTIQFPDGRPPITQPRKEIRAPVGAIITTSAEETAHLRFESGSILEVGPESRVVIRAWALDLQQGSCRVRHVGTEFPLKVGGVATLTISRDSSLEAAREGDLVTATVQAGRIRVSGLAEEVRAGEKVIAAGDKVQRAEFAPALSGESGPGFWASGEGADAADPFGLLGNWSGDTGGPGESGGSTEAGSTEAGRAEAGRAEPPEPVAAPVQSDGFPDLQKILDEKQVTRDD